MKQKKTLAVILAACCLFACKKELTPSQPTDQNSEVDALPGNPPPGAASQLQCYKLLAKEVLKTTTLSSKFVPIVYQECVENDKNGHDFTIKLSRLLQLDSIHNFFGTRRQDITQLVDCIRTSDPEKSEDPLIFVPFLEDRDLDSVITHCGTGMPQICVAPEYNDVDATCPSYDLDNSGNLTQRAFTTEELAWGGPIWVLNQEEDVAPGQPNTGSGTSQTMGLRANGYKEYCGNIQITNLGKVESWVNGKVEMRIVVHGANGQDVKSKTFDKVKRKHFRDSAWYDYGEFLTNWNTGNLGNYMFERWYEIDGGRDKTITHTYASPIPGLPSVTVTFTIPRKSESLDGSIVQFSDDPDATIYGITYMNFKRRSTP